MTRRWVVRAGDPSSVAGIVARAGGDARAVEEGRVFVGRRRARGGHEAVRVGDEVTVAPLLPSPSPSTAITILAEESDFVAVDKPAGVPTIADHGGAAHALVALAAAALSIAPSRLHPTSRLDREVSGVVVLALGPGAAARFAHARETHAYVRRYVAIAASPPLAAPGAAPSSFGTWDAPIGRAKDRRHRAANGQEPVAARTHFAVVARARAGAGREALLALAPVTGRTHQLRVHAAHAGASLLGDRVYGGPSRIALPTGRVLALDRVALHAARVTVPRANGEALTLVSPIPRELVDLWLSLGGPSDAWDTAMACSLATS